MIHSTSNIFGYTRPDALGASPNKTAQSAPQQESLQNVDRVSNSNTEALRTALKNTPEIRPDVVERGRLLAADSNYPPRQIIAGIAKLMVDSRDPADQA